MWAVSNWPADEHDGSAWRSTSHVFHQAFEGRCTAWAGTLTSKPQVCLHLEQDDVRRRGDFRRRAPREVVCAYCALAPHGHFNTLSLPRWSCKIRVHEESASHLCRGCAAPHPTVTEPPSTVICIGLCCDIACFTPTHQQLALRTALSSNPSKAAPTLATVTPSVASCVSERGSFHTRSKALAATPASECILCTRTQYR